MWSAGGGGRERSGFVGLRVAARRGHGRGGGGGGGAEQQPEQLEHGHVQLRLRRFRRAGESRAARVQQPRTIARQADFDIAQVLDEAEIWA